MGATKDKFRLQFGDKELDLNTPKIMGILNLTPDSFYDGGKFNSDNDIHIRVETMLLEGADIIDIGAVSTKPGADEVSEEEELNRLLPVVKTISSVFPETIISVDTYRSEVARLSINEGAHIINDISGGTFDKQMAQTIAELNVPYILMHIKGSPKNMQDKPEYKNVTNDVFSFFEKQLEILNSYQVYDNIILDPGFGFGKNLEHNYKLLKNLDKLKRLGYPILAGVSRKSMINKVLDSLPENALNGTTVVNTIALLNGANILRVHDVKAANEAIKICNYYKTV